ncbi:MULTISPECIES: uroporphyrinogen-III C-methyltransferase [Microbacterium]|uniref:uroporphyrinogen-III C-methyltransferase n=1 Tax=Microbacterium TaxID=33882 RepID=UPI00217E4CBF|nr:MULTISPECIES: uroporphyrinogen-III C-methyltransferase [Microbacterium]UWF77440.1 uroporphyrinogen-III C-methyltransferase [Microbacterium neungamense]WCM55603.1 uroporphyrinogen-III C-methyltransferase [Microbacterium sp. EF45047]
MTTGTVTLVGAGPGDAGLLTLRGLRALRAADVIVADRLGARAVLDQLAAEGERLRAEIVDVGKHPGHHPVPQERINALLVRYAREGKAVVRLKGGDPFVFGRGREEQLYCQAEGVPVEVVPGVTSAVSVPAVAGIPLTHRGVAAAFTVASAHDPLEELPGGRDHTVVLLMGVGTLAHAAHVLSLGERGTGCPVAIVEDGYGDRERVTVATLGDIARVAAARRVRNPAVIVVGDVVRLSPHAPAGLGTTAAGDAAPNTSGVDTPRVGRDAPQHPASGVSTPELQALVTRIVAAFDAGLAVDAGLADSTTSRTR